MQKTKSIKDIVLFAIKGFAFIALSFIILVLISIILVMKDNHETLKLVYKRQLYLTDSLSREVAHEDSTRPCR